MRDIEYKIHGNDMQYIELALEQNDSVVAEAGGMMMMDSNIKMETIFGDGSNKEKNKGLLGNIGGAAKRLFTGESLFMTTFTNAGYNKSNVSFAAPYPGKIIPIDLKQYNGKIICQKDSFLCATRGTSIGVAFTKKLSAGFFGGEGFILQKIEGDGMAFIHAGGTMCERELAPGESIKIDTGSLVAMSQDIDYSIESVGGIKNSLFGGEGLFFARLTGPGKVIIQSLPFSKLASRVYQAAPQAGGKSVGTGSVLGGLADIFES